MIFRRVVITGLGVVGPYGNDKDVMFEELMRGRSAIAAFQLTTEVGKIAVIGAATPENAYKAIAEASDPTCDRVGVYAAAAVNAAIEDARLDLSKSDLERVGVSVGTSLGGVISQEAAYVDVLMRGKSRLSPFTLVRVMYNSPAAHIALTHRL